MVSDMSLSFNITWYLDYYLWNKQKMWMHTWRLLNSWQNLKTLENQELKNVVIKDSKHDEII